MKLETVEYKVQLPDCDVDGYYDSMTNDEWLQLRKTGIGGSDAGGILGKSKYTSPLSVWMDKTGRAIPDDLSENEFVQMGNLLEPFIRRELVGSYIQELYRVNVDVIDPIATYRSKENPYMIINPDGFLIIDGNIIGLEIKTGNSYVLPQWGGKDGDEIPDSYYCQVQHYMAGTGLAEWWVFGLIGNQRLLRIVPRNEEFIANMIEEERKFWELVELNDPLYAPMPSGTEADMEALFILGNPQQETTANLNDIDYRIEEYLKLTAEIKELTAKKKLINQQLIAALGTSKYGESDAHKVTYSRFLRSNFDKKGFEKDNPGILDPYIKQSETGRLSVKNI